MAQLKAFQFSTEIRNARNGAVVTSCAPRSNTDIVNGHWHHVQLAVWITVAAGVLATGIIARAVALVRVLLGIIPLVLLVPLNKSILFALFLFIEVLLQ